VLNGVLSGSLAGSWSRKLQASFGYAVLPADDATAKVAASEIFVVTPGYLPEAQHLAQQIGVAANEVFPSLPAAAPVKASERTTANLILIIGPNLVASA